MCDFGLVIPCGSQVLHKTSKAVSVWMDGLVRMTFHGCRAVCGRMFVSTHRYTCLSQQTKGFVFRHFCYPEAQTSSKRGEFLLGCFCRLVLVASWCSCKSSGWPGPALTQLNENGLDKTSWLKMLLNGGRKQRAGEQSSLCLETKGRNALHAQLEQCCLPFNVTNGAVPHAETGLALKMVTDPKHGLDFSPILKLLSALSTRRYGAGVVVFLPQLPVKDGISVQLESFWWPGSGGGELQCSLLCSLLHVGNCISLPETGETLLAAVHREMSLTVAFSWLRASILSPTAFRNGCLWETREIRQDVGYSVSSTLSSSSKLFSL